MPYFGRVLSGRDVLLLVRFLLVGTCLFRILLLFLVLLLFLILLLVVLRPLLQIVLDPLELSSERAQGLGQTSRQFREFLSAKQQQHQKENDDDLFPADRTKKAQVLKCICDFDHCSTLDMLQQMHFSTLGDKKVSKCHTGMFRCICNSKVHTIQ